MSGRPKYRRRTYFLKEGSQLRLIIGIQVIFFVLLVVGDLLFYLVARRDLGQTYLSAHITVKNVSEVLLPTLIAMNIVWAALSMVASIFFTYRIAGPAFNLCRALREIGQGNLDKKVTFRKNDEMRELAQAANEMLEALNHRLRLVKAEEAAIQDDTGKLTALVVDGRASACPAMQVAKLVAGNGQELEPALSRFKALLDKTDEACLAAGQAKALADRIASLEKELAGFRLRGGELASQPMPGSAGG